MSNAMSSPIRTLFAPGNEEAWASINAEHARHHHDLARRATVGQRIERGLALSELAHDIRVAVRGATADVRPS